MEHYLVSVESLSPFLSDADRVPVAQYDNVHEASDRADELNAALNDDDRIVFVVLAFNTYNTVDQSHTVPSASLL